MVMVLKELQNELRYDREGILHNPSSLATAACSAAATAAATTDTTVSTAADCDNLNGDGNRDFYDHDGKTYIIILV